MSKLYRITRLTEKQAAGVVDFLENYHTGEVYPSWESFLEVDVEKPESGIGSTSDPTDVLNLAGIKIEPITVVHYAGKDDYTATVPSPVYPGEVIRAWGVTAEKAVEAVKQWYLDDLASYKPRLVGVEEWAVAQ